MPERIGEQRFAELLPAYVDGELDAAARQDVVEFLREHPDAIAAVLEQEQLRSALGRTLRRQSPLVPLRLQQRIAALAGQPSTAAPNSRRISPWIWTAAACLLLASGVGIGVYVQGEKPALTIASRFSATLVSGLTMTHVHCSRFEQHINRAARTAAGPLPPALAKLDQGDGSVADLGKMGYRFVGAEPCPVPGGTTLHLLYRATGGSLDDTISLFVQEDKGQVDIAPDQLYTAADGASPHPILIWRSGGRVWYLVGDAMDTVNSAARIVRGAAI